VRALRHDELTEVVVVTYNSAKHIPTCLESIAANGARALIVDNSSTDETLAIVREHFPEATVLPAGENLGYARAMNLGFAQTQGEFVVFSNADVVYDPEAIPCLVAFLRKHPEVGITGPQQTFPDGSWQRSYGDLPGLCAGFKDAAGITSIHNWARRLAWPRKIDRQPKDVPYVDGGVMVVRRLAFEAIGGFDGGFYFYGEESDFCTRLKKAGWRVVFFPEATVKHARGASSVPVDGSDRFLRLLVDGQSRLAHKHLPSWKLHLYRWLERVGFYRLALTHRLLRLFVADSRWAEFEARIRTFKAYSRLWGEQATEPAPERKTL
jgi:N-acetylglucosaminyl-diphospho-decaprenol L-rhamnosyltransferase